MSKCCTPAHDGATATCPVNGQPLKSVGRRTVETLVQPQIKDALESQPYYFCSAPDCDVVYVSALGDHMIAKDQLTARVGIKEAEDPIPLCYCFGYDRKAIRDDVRANGDTDIQKVITRRIRDGECRCEVTNPSGGCCLGDVSRAIKLAKAMRDEGVL